MNYYLITGTSSGIGEAIARRLLISGNTLFCISRRLNEDLADTASALHVPLFYTEGDLTEPFVAETFIRDSFNRIIASEAENIVLINNAGMLQPISHIENIPYEMIELHSRINYLAPVQLSSLFIRLTQEMEVPRVILNISSGASQAPYEGWTLYCSSKAALDMVTRVAGLEQGENGVKVIALAPGIVETNMQEQIRQADPAEFKAQEKFVKLFEEGKLSQPDSVAHVIAAAILNRSIPQGSVLSIDQLKSYIPD